MPFKVSARAHEGQVIVSGLSATEPMTAADALELGRSLINAASHVERVQAHSRGEPEPALETYRTVEPAAPAPPRAARALEQAAHGEDEGPLPEPHAPPPRTVMQQPHREPHFTGGGRRHQPNIQHGSEPTNETPSVSEFTGEGEQRSEQH